MQLRSPKRCFALAVPVLLLLHFSCSEAVRDSKYYDLLGIATDADEATIKRAYRKQAMKWHPDRNPDNVEKAEDKFRDIAAAYEVLVDDDKRKMYDQFGEEGLRPEGPGGGPGGPGGPFPGGGTFRFQSSGDPFEMFNAFFGGGMGGSRGGQQRVKVNMGGGSMGGMGGGGIEDILMGAMGGGGMGGMGGMGGGMPGGLGGGMPGGGAGRGKRGSRSHRQQQVKLHLCSLQCTAMGKQGLVLP